MSRFSLLAAALLVAMGFSLPAAPTAAASIFGDWTGAVPSDGTTVEVTLPAGSYFLVATGTFQYARGGTSPSDASRAYHPVFGDCWDPPANVLDLLVNELSAWSPSCDSTFHEYDWIPVIECPSSCVIRLRILDDYYGDNEGSLTVSITRTPDGDNIPDFVEAELCGPPLGRTLLENIAPNAGECENQFDYRPPTQFGGVNRPHDITLGADEDKDGFPASITITRARTIVKPFDERVVYDEEGPDMILTIDPNDHDPATPAPNQLELPILFIVSAERGPDADGDGFPASLIVTFARATIHRDETEPITLQYSVQEYPVDPDDADGNVPLTNTVGPIRIPTSAFGTDRDGDRVPGTLTIRYADYTIDRTVTPPLTSTSSGTESYTLDPDDGTRGAGSVSYDPFDGDRDDIPDAIEPILCQIQNDNRPEDGICPTSAKDDYQSYIAPSNPWNRT